MILTINKPVGPTSHDIIDQLREVYPGQKIGHAGTLDPLASGVLVVAVGRQATKKISELVAKEKEYAVTIKLGQSSTTDDEEGEKTDLAVDVPPSIEEIKDALNKFIGSIEQVPPQFSAVKVGGQTAYKAARQGKTIELGSRRVEIKSIDLATYDYPILKLRVVTGPGVYIRSLARDLGQQLKTGGYVQSLERTRVGEFSLDQATTVEELQERVDKPSF